MRLANNEKRETTHERRNGTTKSRQYLKAQRKRNLQILWNFGSWQYQTSGDERKNLKWVSPENQKAIWNQTIGQEPYKRDKYQNCPSRKILGTILEMDQRGT